MSNRLFPSATKAVVAVHIYGHAADLDALSAICKRAGIYLVEDCAQAHGAKYRGKVVGSIGDISAFSFYPSKNLGAIGDGGAVASSNPDLIEKCRLYAEYGWRERYISDLPGFNSRLDEVQAAILRIKLRHLHADNEARRSLAKAYCEALSRMGVQLPQVRKDCEQSFTSSSFN